MTLTTDDDRRRTTAVVTVRVPHGTDDDLATDAQRRLSRADGALAVTVDALRDLQPGLSATDVTVAVTVEFDGARSDDSVAAAMSDLTGVEIER